MRFSRRPDNVQRLIGNLGKGITELGGEVTMQRVLRWLQRPEVREVIRDVIVVVAVWIAKKQGVEE